jgi:hypothetical protein
MPTLFYGYTVLPLVPHLSSDYGEFISDYTILKAGRGSEEEISALHGLLHAEVADQHMQIIHLSCVHHGRYSSRACGH